MQLNWVSPPVPLIVVMRVSFSSCHTSTALYPDVQPKKLVHCTICPRQIRVNVDEVLVWRTMCFELDRGPCDAIKLVVILCNDGQEQ